MLLGTHEQRPATRHEELIPRYPNAAGAANRLTWALTGLVACASLIGLLVQGVYTGAESTAAMLRGYDLVSASVVAHLVLASLVAYVVYTYAYFLVGTGFNDVFLLHA